MSDFHDKTQEKYGMKNKMFEGTTDPTALACATAAMVTQNGN